MRLGRHEQGRGVAAPGPLVAALVETVVDPGQRADARVRVERAQLPVRRAEAGGPVEAQKRQLRKAEDVGQVVIGFRLPTSS